MAVTGGELAVTKGLSRGKHAVLNESRGFPEIGTYEEEIPEFQSLAAPA
jgi:hypothetical protein